MYPKYRTKNGKDPPSRSSIRRWHKKFMETGSVLDAVRRGRPRTSAKNIESVRQAFSHCPTKPIRTAAIELELLYNIAQGSTQKVTKNFVSISKRFCFNEPGYKLCLLLRSNHLIRVYLTHS